MSFNKKTVIIVLLLIGIGYLLWKFFFEKGIKAIKVPEPSGYKPLGLELVQQQFQQISMVPSTSVIGEVQLKTPTYTTSVVSAPTLAETTAPSVPTLAILPAFEPAPEREILRAPSVERARPTYEKILMK